TIRTRCGAGRTELDFALHISNATRTRMLTRATATRGCMSRSGHVPERLAGSEADGNVALWRGCTLRVSGNRQSRRAPTPMGQGSLHRPQSCRLENPKVHV